MQKAKRKLKKSSKIIIAALLIVIISIAIVTSYSSIQKLPQLQALKRLLPPAILLCSTGNALLVFDQVQREQ